MSARLLAILTLLGALALLPRLAWADVELTLSLGAREVSVGEAVQVRLDALSDDDEAPSEPELSLPSGFEVRGPSVGTRQQVVNLRRHVHTSTISLVCWAVAFMPRPRGVPARQDRAP